MTKQFYQRDRLAGKLRISFIRPFNEIPSASSFPQCFKDFGFLRSPTNLQRKVAWKRASSLSHSGNRNCGICGEIIEAENNSF
jgi:hypothetical protein